MKQLVIRLSPWGSDEDDFEKLILLEAQLTQTLDGIADVDGHDMGSNEANIFIFTHDVKKAFMDSLPIIQRMGLIAFLGAAFREIDGDEYARIWPEHNNDPFIVV